MLISMERAICVAKRVVLADQAESPVSRPAGEEGQIAVKVKPERPVGMFREYWRDAEGMEHHVSDATLAAMRAVLQP